MWNIRNSMEDHGRKGKVKGENHERYGLRETN